MSIEKDLSSMNKIIPQAHLEGHLRILSKLDFSPISQTLFTEYTPFSDPLRTRHAISQPGCCYIHDVCRKKLKKPFKLAMSNLQRDFDVNVLWLCRGFYDTLGVSKTATKQEIQAAYRGLVLRYHPDRVAENEKKSANKKFQQIQEAYTVLRDAKKRQMYDSGSSF